MELFSAPYAIFGPQGATTDGAALIHGGRVQKLGPRAELVRAHPSARERRFSTYLGLPPVNAHVHLDLGLGPVFRGPFMDFVLKAVFPRNPARGLALARAAAGAAKQTALGDIAARDEATVEWWLTEAPLEGVVYWEVLGLGDRAFEDAVLEKTRARVRRWKRLERPGGPRLGLSPHAPYSLTPRLMKRVVELAREEGLPLQIHAAESPAERAYFETRTGAIAEFHRRMGYPLDLHPRGLSPIAYLADLGVLEARPTLVHGVQVDEDDLRILAQHRIRVVSCPRSNLNLEAGLPPYRLYQKHRVPVALGTDSALSGGSLDVWDEVRTLLERGEPAKAVLEAAVLEGARALGLPIRPISPGDPAGRVVGW